MHPQAHTSHIYLEQTLSQLFFFFGGKNANCITLLEGGGLRITHLHEYLLNEIPSINNPIIIHMITITAVSMAVSAVSENCETVH